MLEGEDAEIPERAVLRVDFYYLTRDPVEKVVPTLAAKALERGGRVLLVSQNAAQRDTLGNGLWTHSPSSFLAHDSAGSPLERHQPILLSETPAAANGATFIMLADGVWREEALQFERVFYMFTQNDLDTARSAWRELSARDDISPHYWKQDGGRWVEGP